MPKNHDNALRDWSANDYLIKGQHLSFTTKKYYTQRKFVEYLMDLFLRKFARKSKIYIFEESSFYPKPHFCKLL